MILDMLFPKRCVGCGVYDTYLCHPCVQQHLLPRVDDLTLQEMPYQGVLTLGPYANPFWRTVVEQLKFHGVYEIAPPIGEILADVATSFLSLPTQTVLTPIPLHKKRIRERGFNQSERVGQSMAHHLNRPLYNLLERTRYTKPQSGKALHERATNVADAFICKKTTLGTLPELILLIDDVYTTGATALHAVHALRAVYQCPIIVVAIAHG